MGKFIDEWLTPEEQAQFVQEDPGVIGDLVERVKSDQMLQAKLVSGMLPADIGLKTIDILSERFKEPIKAAAEPYLEQLSNEPVMKPEVGQGLNLLNPTELGMALGGNVSQRQAGNLALDIATDPRTYIYSLGGKALSLKQTGGAIAPEIAAGTPVGKIITALREAAPIRGKQEALYAAERAKRAGTIAGIGKNIPGEAGFHAQLGALKGELPKVQFEGIRSKITQPDIDSLFNSVESHGTLLPFEKITAKTGLAKLLGEGGGSVPTEGELKLLGEVFPREFISEVLTKRPMIQKFKEAVGEALNVPRALMASFDLSAPLRQGIFLVGRPKQWLPAARDMFKYAFSEKSYQGLMEGIKQRPTYALMKESGLPMTDIGSALTGREEAFMSNLAEKIPGVGKIVRGSNRAYTGFLNKLRADTFDDLVRTAEQQGVKVEGKTLSDIGMFVGSATGRGKMPQALERSAVALNSVFFSPRLMASRLNLLNPVYYTKLDPFVRKEALKSLATFSGTLASILTLAKIGGADVGVDPRSADFGKIKVGNTRYDMGGGFLQYLRAATQFFSGKYVSSTTGVEMTLGEGYKPMTRFDILQRQVESKEAPIMSFVTTLLKGQDPVGKKVNLRDEVVQRFIPMVIQDIGDLVKERGLPGVAMGIPGVFGVGLQTYSPTEKEMVYSANSVIKNVKELRKQGRDQQAQALLNRNKDLILKGKKLEPYQKIINKYEKMIDDTEKNVRLSPAQKKQIIANINARIKPLQIEQKGALTETQQRAKFEEYRNKNMKPFGQSEFYKKWGQ
jgi:hypothetical protein